ncbi:MAG: TolB-like 6-bladed beta-propeller domain-containing protein [Tannerellaceae bacterium]|nr:TolB-like 6-bladed beta-propeller domain-containing protein [Tannerellaceae bacterium]
MIKFNQDENLNGFMDVKMNANYIFGLYSGKKSDFVTGNEEGLPRNLLIFDYEGNLLHNLKLDKKCIRIAVSEDNIVYALHLDPESGVSVYDLNQSGILSL